MAMSIADNQGLSQVSTVTARVCDCTGEDVSCREKDVGGSNPPVILGILKATVVLLTSEFETSLHCVLTSALLISKGTNTNCIHI